MMFITFILIIVNLLSNGLALEDLLSFGIFALAAFITFIVGFALVLARFFDKNQYLKGTGSAFGPPLMMIIGIIVFALIVVPIVIETVDIDTLFIVSISVCILCLAIMMASSFCLTKRTPYGAELAGKIRGFKNFLETAEKSKLEDLVSENPTYFYDILPYTYVLGVSKKWVSKFESIAIEPPNWYDTNNAAFNVGMMSTFMDKTMVSAASTLNSSPSDSGGSGGGGSSGGGSGGGGGGSW